MAHDKLRRTLGVSCIVLFVVILLLHLMLNAGPGPRILARFVTHWAQTNGVPISVDAVQITGWNSANLHDVRVVTEWATLPEGVEIEQVRVSVDLLEWLSGASPGEALSEIVLIEPRVALAAPVPTGSAPLQAEGAVDASESTPMESVVEAEPAPAPWPFHGARVTVRDGTLLWPTKTGHGEAKLDLYGEVHADGVSIKRFQLALTEEAFSATLHGAARIGHGAAGSLAASISGGPATMVVGGDVYRLDAFDSQLRIGTHGIEIDALEGRRGESRVTVTGTVHADRSLDLALRGEISDLAGELPLLGRYDFSGPGTFDGTLTGTLSDWRLAGESTVGPGEVWGRPNVTGSGALTITPRGIEFDDVHLLQYGGEYWLDGSWTFTREGQAGRLDLNVESDSGRVQEVLALFAGEIPVTGRLFGELQFSGPTDALTVRGNIDVWEAVAWDQPLDRVSGSFHWERGRVHVETAELALGTGKASVAGLFDTEQSAVDLSFSASEWPLGFTYWFEERLGQLVGGIVNVYQGRMIGTLASPQVSGELGAEALRVGPALFRSVAGRIGYADGRIELTDLRGVRAGGGEYALSGAVELPVSGDPVTDLRLQVSNERLRSLLQLANEELPAALIDGEVSGSIEVTGVFSDPVARLELLLEETLAMSRGIRVSMRYAAGALRIEGLELLKG